MTIKCEHCNTINQSVDNFCVACNRMLYSPEHIISKLIRAQERLEQKQASELQALRQQLKRVESYFGQQKIAKPINEFKETITSVSHEKIKEPKSVVITETKPVHTEVVKEVFTKPITAKYDNVREVPLVKPKEPSVLAKQISTFFEPMADGLDLVKQAFTRYKKEGKLPIVLMTMAGILAILVGVGYLMQLSFESLGVFSGVVKVGLGFIASIVIGFFGLRLYKKDEKYQEYSSALLSLMIILNYLLIYFLANLSNFPILSSAQIGFLLIVANTGLSIYLAFKYETKIIAVLSLIGGALTPFYLNESGNIDFYFGYLWILLVAANFIALHIKWYKLNYISFILFLLLVEGAVFTDASQSVLFIGFVHLFAYLFFYIVLFNKWKLKTELSKYDILILTGNLTVLLLNLYNTITDFFWLGIAYLINGGVFVFFLLKGWKTVPKQMKVGLFITIGSFVGLAIPFLFGQTLMGIFWSIEAILLIIMGFVYHMESIRKEGYIVLGIALFKLFMSAVFIVEHWGSGLVNEGFLNYIVLGVVFSALWYVGNKFKAEFTVLESKLYSLFKEIVPVWLSSILFILSFDLVGYYSFNIMILPMFGLIIWHDKFKTKSTEILGLLHLLFLVGAYVISVNVVDSPSFSDQTLYGKIGILELLFSFWFLEFFYHKMGYIEQAKHRIVQGLRILFYVLLPLLFIKQVFKHFNPYFPMAMWVGFMINYGLFKRFKHHVLFVESNLLLLAAIGINVTLYGIEGIGVGILTLVTLLILEKSFTTAKLETSKYFTTLVILPFILFGLIGYAAIREGLDYKYTLLLVGFLVSAYAYFREKYTIVYLAYRIALRIGLVFGIVAGTLILANRPSAISLMLLILLVAGLGYLFYVSKSDYKAKNKLRGWGFNIIVHQLFIIFTYTISIDVMNLDVEGPMMTIFLVLHAIVILFTALKTQNTAMNKGSLFLFIVALIKVIFHDIKDFSGTGKIVVLIVLGVLLLIASYGYVRIKNKYITEEITADNEAEE